MTTRAEAIRDELRKVEAEAKQLFATADAEDKALAASEGYDPLSKDTAEKMSAIWKPYDAKRERAAELNDMLADANRIAGYAGHAIESGLPAGDDKSERAARIATLATLAADRFVNSPNYKALLASGALSQVDAQIPAVGSVEVLTRAELLSVLRGGGPQATTITGGSATSGGPFVQNDVQPGYVEYLRKERRLMDVITVGETDSDTVEYIEQSAVTNQATGVAENAASPEATYAFATKTQAVEETSVYVPITKRAMSDAGQLRTIIETNLNEDVLDKVEDLIATGDGVTPNMKGIYNFSGILTLDAGAYGNRSDAIQAAMTQIRLSRLRPDFVGLHPNDAFDLMVERDDDGRYLYGGPNQAVTLTPWGIPAVIAEAFTEGTPLVGAGKRSVTFWLREGVNLTAGLVNDDLIKRRMTLISALRGANAVQRLGGICTITSF